MGKKEDDHIIKTETRQSVLWRDRTYRDNTTKRRWMRDEDVRWQAHHILCNHSVTDANIASAVPKDDLSFAKAVLWITKWDLNAKPNMIGLPLNRQYRESEGRIPENLPSHQVDHNTTAGYTDECTEWLKNNVWNKIKEKGKDHQVNAENMQGVLEGASEHFRILLGERGCRKQGTVYCWDHQFEDAPTGVPKASYKQEKKWYFPFSMANNINVNPRQPGVDWDELEGVLQKIG